MKLAYDLTTMPYLLIALACALVVGLFGLSLVLASIKRNRATKTFGDPDLVTRLESFDAAGRRALKGVLLVIALVSGFLALARPQWGRGQKLVPATNLDVVIVLEHTEQGARDGVPDEADASGDEPERHVVVPHRAARPNRDDGRSAARFCETPIPW